MGTFMFSALRWTPNSKSQAPNLNKFKCRSTKNQKFSARPCLLHGCLELSDLFGAWLGLISRKQMTIAFVSPRIEPAVCHRVLHRALRLVLVRAVGKAAVADKRTNVTIVAGNFLGNYVPELELADARGIDHKAASSQRNQSRRSGRVLSLLILGADLPHLQP